MPFGSIVSDGKFSGVRKEETRQRVRELMYRGLILLLAMTLVVVTLPPLNGIAIQYERILAAEPEGMSRLPDLASQIQTVERTIAQL